MGVLEEEERGKREERIFEEIMTNFFQIYWKTLYIQYINEFQIG